MATNRKFVRHDYKPKTPESPKFIVCVLGGNQKSGDTNYGQNMGYYNSELYWQFARRENATWLNREGADKVVGMLRAVGYVSSVEEF